MDATSSPSTTEKTGGDPLEMTLSNLTVSSPSSAIFLTLPAELHHDIVSYLPAQDLASVSRTHSRLHSRANVVLYRAPSWGNLRRLLQTYISPSGTLQHSAQNLGYIRRLSFLLVDFHDKDLQSRLLALLPHVAAPLQTVLDLYMLPGRRGSEMSSKLLLEFLPSFLEAVPDDTYISMPQLHIPEDIPASAHSMATDVIDLLTSETYSHKRLRISEVSLTDQRTRRGGNLIPMSPALYLKDTLAMLRTRPAARHLKTLTVWTQHAMPEYAYDRVERNPARMLYVPTLPNIELGTLRFDLSGLPSLTTLTLENPPSMAALPENLIKLVLVDRYSAKNELARNDFYPLLHLISTTLPHLRELYINRQVQPYDPLIRNPSLQHSPQAADRAFPPVVFTRLKRFEFAVRYHDWLREPLPALLSSINDGPDHLSRFVSSVLDRNSSSLKGVVASFVTEEAISYLTRPGNLIEELVILEMEGFRNGHLLPTVPQYPFDPPESATRKSATYAEFASQIESAAGAHPLGCLMRCPRLRVLRLGRPVPLAVVLALHKHTAILNAYPAGKPKGIFLDLERTEAIRYLAESMVEISPKLDGKRMVRRMLGPVKYREGRERGWGGWMCFQDRSAGRGEFVSWDGYQGGRVRRGKVGWRWGMIGSRSGVGDETDSEEGRLVKLYD